MQFQLKKVIRTYFPKNNQTSSYQYDQQKRNSLINPFISNTFHTYLNQSLRNIKIKQQNQQNGCADQNNDNDNDDRDSYIQQKRLNKKLSKSNFIKCFKQQIIIQFSNAYLPLIQLDPYIQRIQRIYEFYHRHVYKQNKQTILALEMPYQVQLQLDKLIESIREILSISQVKYQNFLKFKLAYILHDWKIFIHILLEVSEDQIQIRTQEKCQIKHYIKQIIKVIYTNIRYMIDFIELNQQTFYFLRKDLTRYLMPRIKYIRKQKDQYLKYKINNHSFNRNLKSQIIPSMEENINKIKIKRNNSILNLTSQKYHNNNSNKKKQKKSQNDNNNDNEIDNLKIDSIQEHFDYQQSKQQSQSQTQQNQYQYEYNYKQYNQQQYQFPDTEKNLAKLFSLLTSNTTITQSSYKKIFTSLQCSLKCLYSSMVYHDQQKANKLQAYSTLTRKVQSHRNHFLMGLYIGVGMFMIFALLLLIIFGLIQFDQNDTVDSMNYVFPMFRGIGLLILYLWGMAWNIYGFTKYRINHRLILQYGSHYSTHFQMMKRAGFFTLIFSAMLLVYCVIQSLTTKSYFNQQDNFVQYTPFVVYVLYFSYIFFPNRDVFNPKGRRYFYDLLKKIIMSPIIKITFVITWASDQAVSFVIPFKDCAYTVCLYTSVMDLQSAKDCLNPANKQGILVTYVVALVPLILRMIQCYRQAMQTSGKFVGHIQMWNFLKYFSTVITATMSYVSTLQQNFFPFFIASSLISTLYSYYWDIKNDWGLLQKNSKNRFLRNNLCYKNPNYYYLAICINLLLRCTWTLTISPSIVAILHKSTLLPFVTGSLQIFRRCMWNFFRIQKQHIVNCQDYIIMRPQVQKIAQKLKKKDKQNQIIQLYSNQFDGGLRKIKKNFIDKVHASLNLPQLIGKQQYQSEWMDLNKDKIMLKKKDFIEQRQKQKSIFNKTKNIIYQKSHYYQQSIY